jgi:hypothetical protein
MLGRLLARPGRAELRWLIARFDELAGAHRRRAAAVHRRIEAGVMAARAYRRVVVAVGPGIGVGDEVAFVRFVDELRRRFPAARCEVFSFFPAIWRTLAPEVRTRSLVPRPLRGYRQIDSWSALSAPGELLAVFATFASQWMFLPYLGCRRTADLLEIAVGRGTAWWLPAGGDEPRLLRALDPQVPNHGRSLRTLAGHLLSGRGRRPAPADPAAPPRPSPAGDETPFRLFVNPLTTKRIPLAPDDWAGYVGEVRSALDAGGAGARPLEVTVYPGLAAPSIAYAREVVGRVRRAADGGSAVRAGLLAGPGRRPLAAATATGRCFEALGEADLAIGLDTFTAHLAAHAPVVAVNLCLTRNPEFWEEGTNTLWWDLDLGPDTIRRLLRLTLEVRLGGAACRLDRRRCRELADLGPPEAIAGGALDVRESALDAWVAAADAVWKALPPDLRRLFEEVDRDLAWPAVRAGFRSARPSLREIDRSAARVESSLFYRLCRLSAL